MITDFMTRAIYAFHRGYSGPAGLLKPRRNGRTAAGVMAVVEFVQRNPAGSVANPADVARGIAGNLANHDAFDKAAGFFGRPVEMRWGSELSSTVRLDDDDISPIVFIDDDRVGYTMACVIAAVNNMKAAMPRSIAEAKKVQP
jgi:hypothetical protein